MKSVERNGEQRALLPFEDVALILALLPHLGGAAAFDHQHDFFVEMPLDIQRAGAGHFDDVKPPQSFGAEQLDERAATAEPRPGHERQILHPAHADAAIARHAFGLHEAVIGQRLALEFSEAGVLARLRFMPMGAIGGVVHDNVSSYRIRTSPPCRTILWANPCDPPNRGNAAHLTTRHIAAVDGGGLLVVDGGAAERGDTCLRTPILMLLRRFRIQRLTALAKAAEDAEKTAVFHYSKVKQVTTDAPLPGRTRLSECNIITSHSPGTVPIWRWPGARTAERTV